MASYTKDATAEWTPLSDDKFRVELIDADSRRAVPVVVADIFLDTVHWYYRAPSFATVIEFGTDTK
ncbi:hypothetical protein ETAA8_39690 [Anatilimnocola aggregata]|uniref:Uncharacterized protein n=1 Tax=Anatilimnocola aggregata TaxID=2528021 RepID=A0A517YF53_9BACT|nr:hypothetical protein [Anatilimnocola aggregata]QDU28863.1 hypothetical protein ETAA8_39690 [Anatilimnocola aggregata]